MDDHDDKQVEHFFGSNMSFTNNGNDKKKVFKFKIIYNNFLIDVRKLENLENHFPICTMNFNFN